MIPSIVVACLQQQTTYDEDVIGCFFHNYGSSRTCGAFQNSGCKDAARCKHIENVVRKQKSSQIAVDI